MIAMPPPTSQDFTAYLNGCWLPLSQAAVSIFDTGFVQGVTVAEQLRTFGGRLFRLDLHLERLARSLEIIGVDPGLPLAELGRIATELVDQNHRLLDPADYTGAAAALVDQALDRARPSGRRPKEIPVEPHSNIDPIMLGISW